MMKKSQLILEEDNFLVQAFWQWRRVWLCGLVLALVAAGCKKEDEGPDVMASVGGVKIMRSEVEKTFKQQTSGAPRKLSAEEENGFRLQILHQLIARQVYLLKAEKLGMTATADQVETRLNDEKKPFTKEEFAKKLQDLGLTEPELREELRKQLTIDKLFKEISAKAAISDAEIQSFYNEHKGQFNVAEPTYRLAHIFTTGQPIAGFEQNPDKARNDAQARQKIEMLHKRLLAGDDFAQLAARYSEDPGAANNGGQITLTESQLKGGAATQATRDAIARLKPGQFTGVIPIVNPSTNKAEGYRIVLLIAREPAGQRDLSDPDVQSKIREHLRGRKEEFLKAAYDEAAHNGVEINNYFAARLVKEAGLK